MNNNLKLTFMRTTFFIIFFIGYLLLFASILLTNIHLLAVSEIIIIGSSIFLIKTNLRCKQNLK